MTKRVLVTGAAGCIGAWICKKSLERGWQPIATDITDNYHRWPTIMTSDQMASIPKHNVDITDFAALDRSVADTGATQIIHTAALQIPFNRAEPTIGALVNVVGTVNVFEATRLHELGPVVYASSVAIYGSAAGYPTEILPADAEPNPAELYGVNKICNEGTARIYWEQQEVASIGLRPHTVYGPGRDAGMTADPTKAILAAIRGESYHIGYGGRSGFQYVEDVADIMLIAAGRDQGGAELFNIRGQVADMSDFIAAIDAAVPGSGERISYAPDPLDLPAGMDDLVLRAAFGDIPNHTLQDGVAASVAIFEKETA